MRVVTRGRAVCRSEGARLAYLGMCRQEIPAHRGIPDPEILGRRDHRRRRGRRRDRRRDRAARRWGRDPRRQAVPARRAGLARRRPAPQRLARVAAADRRTPTRCSGCVRCRGESICPCSCSPRRRFRRSDRILACQSAKSRYPTVRSPQADSARREASTHGPARRPACRLRPPPGSPSPAGNRRW